MRLFIFGTGFSSKAFVEEVRDQFDWIGGTTRSSDKTEALRTLGVEPFLFDGNSQGDGVAEALKQATHILVSIAPNEAGDPVLNQYANEIAGAKPRWIGYLSTDCSE